MVSLLIAKQFNISKKNRFALISIIAPSIITIGVIYNKVYNYTPDEWINHIILLYLLYIFVFNVIVFLLDKYV